MKKLEQDKLLAATRKAVKWLKADDELGRFSGTTVRAVLRILKEALPTETANLLKGN